AYRSGRWQPFEATLSELPLRWWRRSLPEGSRLRNDPRLRAHLDFISSNPLRAAADFRLDASEWRWRTGDSPQTLNLDVIIATATLNPNQARLAANLNAPTLGRVGAELAVTDPLGARQLRGLLTLSDLQLAALGWAVPDVDTMKGEIDGALAISGTAQQPLLQGQFELKDGAISALGSTDTVSDINALLSFANQRGTLASEFKLGKGSGKLDGEMTWAETPQDRKVELVLQGSNLRVEPLANSEVLFSPNLKLLVTPGNSRLEGAVQVDKADIKMAQLPPETVSPSRDAVVSGRETKQAERPFTMDVALRLGKNTHFSGFGADVDLTGKLRLQAESAQEMATTGQIKVTKGRYRAYGQRLIVRKGQFIFSGDLDNPDLNLEAIREFPPGNRDIVGLRITGPLRDPVAQLFSDQGLSESEIAYYLLTGRKNDSSTPNQQFSAGGSLLSLGLAGGEEQAAKLAQKFGISGFSIGTTAAQDGGTEAEVSGYVFRDLYVRYGRNLGEQVDSVTLQYPLTEKLMIQTISSIEQTVELIYTFTVD
ncbi:MAG TPA: translocation/assembly module TamB domain-containing protein, partial [Spirillospora sp.]|nr:translocation/assembly module TamB domain-containing protein [Spirillospora sp.]